MTARAARTGSPPWRAIARLAAGVGGSLSVSVPSAAHAQVGAIVSVYNDDRFRGVSFSDGRPVGILDLSYDAPHGLYGAVSGRVVATRHEGVKALGYSVDGGYARRLRSGLSVDLGIVHSHYSHYSGLLSGRSYTEAYAGIAGKLVGGRLSISPDYLGSSHWTAHGEIDGHLNLSRQTLVEGELGVLTSIGGAYRRSGRAEFDARLGVAQRAGPLTLHAALTTRSRANSYQGATHGRTAVVVGLSLAL